MLKFLRVPAYQSLIGSRAMSLMGSHCLSLIGWHAHLGGLQHSTVLRSASRQHEDHERHVAGRRGRLRPLRLHRSRRLGKPGIGPPGRTFPRTDPLEPLSRQTVGSAGGKSSREEAGTHGTGTHPLPAGSWSEGASLQNCREAPFDKGNRDTTKQLGRRTTGPEEEVVCPGTLHRVGHRRSPAGAVMGVPSTSMGRKTHQKDDAAMSTHARQTARHRESETTDPPRESEKLIKNCPNQDLLAL